jgi:hypothetical protein
MIYRNVINILVLLLKNTGKSILKKDITIHESSSIISKQFSKILIFLFYLCKSKWTRLIRKPDKWRSASESVIFCEQIGESGSAQKSRIQHTWMPIETLSKKRLSSLLFRTKCDTVPLSWWVSGTGAKFGDGGRHEAGNDQHMQSPGQPRLYRGN